MKRLALLVLLVLLAVSVFAQVQVLYRESVSVEWDAVTTYADGEPLLPDVTNLGYEVYCYDYNDPPTDLQDIGQLTYYTTTANTTTAIVFPALRWWAWGVRAIANDGEGMPLSGEIAWSTVEEDVAPVMGGPFVCVPVGVENRLEKSDNLREQGM